MGLRDAIHRAKRILKIVFYLSSPFLALCSVYSLVNGISPIETIERSEFLLFFMLLPWYLGVLCAPLYSYVVLFNIKKNTLKGIKLTLVNASLKGAILASFLGLEAVLIVYPTPFVIASIISSILVFKTYKN